jgi:hypothetical protein
MTYLEDLPEGYSEIAKAILSKRKKTVGKSSKKLEDSPQVKLVALKRTIEGESLKENSAENAPAPSEEKPELQPCGHPTSEISLIDEGSGAGTQHCIACSKLAVAKAAQTAADLAAFEAFPAASAGMPPQPHTAGVATPQEDWCEFKREYLPRVCAVLEHESASSTDTAALKRIWQMNAPREKWKSFLAHIENGGGAEFRKPGANAFWMSNKFDDFRRARERIAPPIDGTGYGYNRRLT